MIKKVYLAGGFKSGWQEIVKSHAPSYVFLDPSLHDLDEPEEYTKWDLDAVQKSDIIFAYMESTNPAGYALSLEIGFAKALGKEIIFIEEHPNENRKRHFAMVRECADKNFKTLIEAIEYLKSSC
jgi:nucleoside 2-deoxyribosyltransferase